MTGQRVSRIDPIQSSAAQVISRNAVRLLRNTDAAVARLADKTDLQALHDSRVNLRRLRGWLQAFDTGLKLKRKQRRCLRRLAQATNPARDAEVCIEWLNRLRPDLNPLAQAGVGRFTQYLGSMRDQNYRHIRTHLPPAWSRLSRKLLHTATTLRDSRHQKAEFQQVYAVAVRDYALSFIAAREQARIHPDAVRIHRLRIAAKKLRYLLEYILPWRPSARPLVNALKTLHEAAGAVQDLERFRTLSQQVFLQQAGARYRRLLLRYADTGADHRSLGHPDLTPGLMPLLWISRAACIRQSQYIARIRREYLSRKRPACVLHLRQFLAETTRLGKSR